MKEVENYQVKAKFRFDTNLTLLLVAFTVFTLLLTISPDLLRNQFFLPIEITLSIPLLIGSIFARSKLAWAKNHTKAWEDYGFITFLLAYTFLINSIGILLSSSVNLIVGLTFFIFCFLMAISYSFFEIIESKEKIWSRIRKDLFFGLLIFIGGVLPSINFHF